MACFATCAQYKFTTFYEKDDVFKGATKLYFTRYSWLVIILFNTGLDKSAFFTYSFGKLVFRLRAFSVFSASSVFRFHLNNIYITIVYISVRNSVILFSLNKKQSVKTNIMLRKFDYSQGPNCKLNKRGVDISS